MNALKKILYNCRKSTYLIDKRLIGKITIRETVELKIHLVGCGICRIYMDQSLKINQMVREMINTNTPYTIKLDDSLKQDMQQLIDSHINKS